MRRASDNKREYSKYCLIAVLIVFLISASLAVLQYWERQKGLFPGHEIGDDALTYKGMEYVLKEDIETFLVIGLDKVSGASVSVAESVSIFAFSELSEMMQLLNSSVAFSHSAIALA